MFYVLGITTSDLCFCRVEAFSLTVVTEAAGEQSTSATSLCTVCHGNKDVLFTVCHDNHAQRSK